MEIGIYRPDHPELKEAVDIVSEHGFSKEHSYQLLVSALIRGDLVARRGRAGFWHDVEASYWYHWRQELRAKNEASLNKTVYFPSRYYVSLHDIQEWLLNSKSETTPLVSIDALRRFLLKDEIKELTRNQQKQLAKEEFGAERVTDRRFKEAIPEARRPGRKPKADE